MKVYTSARLIYSANNDVIVLDAKSYSTKQEVAQAKGRKPTQNVTHTNAPWDPQQRYLTDTFGQASRLYEQNRGGIPFFPGQTFAPQSQQTLQALQGIEDRARAGSPLQRAGNEQLLRTVQGDYLSNPFLPNAIRSEFNRLLPSLQSNASRSGNFFSSAAQLGQARELGDIIDRRMADQYNQERGRQMAAIGLSPAFAANEYNDLSRLANVGALREAQDQRGIDEARARHEQQYLSPYDVLQRYQGGVSGNYGSSGTQTTTGFSRNRGAGAVGGALGGAQLASMLGSLGGSGAGAAAGAGAGGAASGAAMGAIGGPMGILGGAILGGLLGGLF